MQNPRRIGLISDTHGLLREAAIAAMRGVDLILHAGDVGHPEILEKLKALAPVVAVRGNIDTAPWAKELPESAIVQAGPVKFLILHDLHALDHNPKTAGIRCVVSGHSHQPGSLVRDGVLYINPGSAGPRRFNLPISLALLDLQVDPWGLEFVELNDAGKHS